jgi:ribonuclease HII
LAASVVLTDEQASELLSLGLADSKKLTARRRELLFDRMNELRVVWRAQAATHIRIDGMNILRATLWAMARSLARLPPVFDEVIVDGTITPPGLLFPARAVPKADSLHPQVAAASVVAKVLRDRAMRALDSVYPQYKLAKNKGYPTGEHRAALLLHGPSPVHRRSFTWRSRL